MDHDDRLIRRLHDAQDRRSAAIEAGDDDAWIAAARDCGIAHLELEQERLAELLLGEALGRIDETGRSTDQRPLLIGTLGRIHQRRRDANAALDHYVRAAEAAATLGDVVAQLRWQTKRASTLIDMGLADTGLPLLEEAVALGRAAPSSHAVDRELSRALGRLASCREHNGDSREAGDLWAEALSRLENVPESTMHALAATNYGMFLLRGGEERLDLAITYLEEGVELTRRTDGEPARVLEAVRFLAAGLRDQDPIRAGELLLDAADEQHDPKTRHDVVTEAVDHLFAAHAWAPMRRAALTLVDLRLQGGTPHGRYDAELRLSIACRGLGEFDESLAALARAREHAIESDDPGSLAAVDGQRLLVLVDAGRFAEAAQVGRELWDRGHRHRLAARALVRSLCEIGELDGAERIRDGFAAAGGPEVDVAWSSAVLADHGRGDPEQAWYDVGLAAERDPAMESEALTRLLRLHPDGSADRFEVAKARLRLIDKARTSVRDVFSEDSWVALTETAREFPRWLDELLDAAVAADRHRDAVYELERYRSQMLVDVISERASRWARDTDDRSRMKSDAIDEYQRARYRARGLDAIGAGWQQRRAAAEDAERKRSLAFSAGGLMHLSWGFTGHRFPHDLETHVAGAALTPGEALVFLHPRPGRTDAWLLDAEGALDHRRLPPPAAFEAAHHMGAAVVSDEEQEAQAPLGRRARRDGAPPTSAPPAARSIELDDPLARPFVAWLAERSVTRAFVTSGTALTALALDRSADALTSGTEFAYLPTARGLGFARATRYPPSFVAVGDVAIEHAIDTMTTHRESVAIVVDPTGSLVFAPIEAAAVARSAAHLTVDTLASDAEAGAIDRRRLRAAAERSGILHVIGHGTFDDASPYRSGMYVDHDELDGDVWTVAEILTDIEAPAGRLVVLSGCETGRTRPSLVTEDVSLPAAFLAAGYAAVVGSRWPVDDLTAALVMSDLYRRWLAGTVSISAALRDSATWLRDLGRESAASLVRELASGDEGWPASDVATECEIVATRLEAGPAQPFAHPVHWAAFFVTGDGAITADGPDPRVPAGA